MKRVEAVGGRTAADAMIVLLLLLPLAQKICGSLSAQGGAIGHTICALVAIVVHMLVRPLLLAVLGWPIPLALERALSPAIGIGLMVAFKVPHPPAAAYCAIFTLSMPAQQTPMYLLFPGWAGCAYMLLVMR